MVLISRSGLDTLSRSVLSQEFLKSIGDPNVEETYARDSTKPAHGFLEIPPSIISVHTKQHSYEDAPADSFHSILIPEYVLWFQGGVLNLILVL